MRRKVIFGILAAGAVIVLLASGFSLGVGVGKRFPQTVIVEGVASTTEGQPGGVDFGTFWQAWQLIGESYLRDKDVSAQEKVYGAIRGLVSSLHDPYSEFFDPEDNEKFLEDIQGNFSGIGAEIGIRKDQLVIVAPLKGTPAMRAGLAPGDQIWKINATSTSGLAVEEAVRMIRGPEQTLVTLTIFREGWEEPKEFPIIRENIVAPTLDFELKGDIAYIALHSFNVNSERLLYDAAVSAFSRGARGIVLDLRNNPGGYLEVAVDLAGWFLPRGTLVVKEASRSGPTEEFRAMSNASLVDIPLVVLINEGSASASEILAGTLRDNRNIKLIGMKSFGKGTVQRVLSLRDDSSIKVTVAHWVLPSGNVLENDGLEPDIEVEPGDDPAKDRQLEKALEVIRGMIR